MLKLKLFFLLGILALLFSCRRNDDVNKQFPSGAMYFPPVGESKWETMPISDLGWNTDAVQALKDYLKAKNTKSFMVLVDGRIVLEEYMNGHTSSASWQWNSAGKTLVASSVLIARKEGLLNIDDKVSKYLGTGWTSEPLDKENLITPRHLLTMTSGLDDSKELVVKANLIYVADAGTRWAYANVFQKLMDVVASASNKQFESYFNDKLKDRIGMEGYWNNGPVFKIYHSNTRTMARFGLLALNKGKWMNEQVLDESFFNECVTSSQGMNPSYGYLWWLNGKSSFMVPGSQEVFEGNLIPNAPSDMFAAMGAGDQRIYVVPSRRMVIVRMGDASNPENPSFAVSGFDYDLWDNINAVIN
ncbi:MAG TPA: serine hydrolase [Paludibacter sp.]|nr:serine hydrolase [Paludibacter sp.]